jgi:hypothetical protein
MPKCLNCDNQASIKFCCRSCSVSFNNRLRTSTRYCKNCGILLNHHQSKYCFHDCRWEFEYQDFIIKWKNGEVVKTSYGGRNNPIRHYIRRYLFEKHNSKCVKCGWSEINPTTGKIPLQVNHIDGNSNNNCEENVELLCPSCHSLTPNFGFLNKGNGRKNRHLR